MQTWNLNIKKNIKNYDHEEEEKVNISWKYNNKKQQKSKTLQEEQGRENNNNILYILCQAVWQAKKEKKEQEV